MDGAAVASITAEPAAGPASENARKSQHSQVNDLTHFNFTQRQFFFVYVNHTLEYNQSLHISSQHAMFPFYL